MNTNYRQAVPVEIRVAAALHYLVAGGSYRSTAGFLRASKSTVYKCV